MVKKLALSIITLFSVTALAQEAHEIAVYVAGDISTGEKRVLETELLKALSGTGRFTAVAGFTAEVDREERDRGLPASVGEKVDDEWISYLGKQFGAHFVCVAEVSAAFGLHVMETRILSAETGKVILSGRAGGQLNSMQAIEGLVDEVVRSKGFKTAGSEPTPPSVYMAQPQETTPPEPTAPASYTWPPKVAVYVTGLAGPLNNALSRAVGSALMKTGIYEGLEHIDKHMSGAPSSDKIIQAAKQAGVDYVFVVNAAGQISVAIIDVNLAKETARVSLSGNISSPLGAAKMAVDIVNFIQKAGPKPPPDYVKPAKETKAVAQGGEKRAKAESDERYGHSIGTSVGIPYGGAEIYWRAGMTRHCRFYTGLGVWRGSKEYENYYHYEYGTIYVAREYHLAGFVEWHTTSNVFNIHIGPGLMLGYHDNYGGSGVGAVGVQTGMELKLGWFLLGTDMRVALYVRSWDSGATGRFGVHTGVAF